MSKIFEWNVYKGTKRDEVSGAEFEISNGSANRNGFGKFFKGLTYYVYQRTLNAFQIRWPFNNLQAEPQKLSFEFFIKPDNSINYYKNTSFLLATLPSGRISISSGRVNIALINAGAASSNGVLQMKKYSHIVIQLDYVNNLWEIFVDGILDNSGIISSKVSWVGTGYMYLFNEGNSFIFGGEYSYIGIFTDFFNKNHIKERAIFFHNLKPLNKPVYFLPNLNVLKPHEIREEGLIAAYNFNPTGGKLINIAWDNQANGNNARQADLTARGQTISDGIILRKKSISLPTILQNLGKVYTIVLKSKLFTGASAFLYYGGNPTLSHGINTITTGTGTSTGLQWATVDGAIVGLNTYSTIVVTRNNLDLTVWLNGKNLGTKQLSSNIDTQITSINFSVGTVDSNATLCEARFYNRVLANHEIKNYHNAFASMVVFKENFSQYPVGATRFGNWVQKPRVGAARINELANNSGIAKKGMRYYDFVSGVPIFYLPGTPAYGKFRFKYKTSNPVGEFWVTFITNSFRNSDYVPYGYTFSASAGGNFYIWRDTGAILLNTGITPSVNTWYAIDIYRTPNNVFKVYINNNFVGQFTDSTYTNSKGFALYGASSGLGFTDLIIKQGIEE